MVELAEQSDPRTVLFAHEAGLTARYWAAGGRELLVKLQGAARRPSEAPCGLWLPVPMEDPDASPALDGRTVDIVDQVSEWVRVKGLFLKELKSRAAAAGEPASRVRRVSRASSPRGV